MKRCECCSKEIPAKRLKARPGARRCVDCQSRHDLDPIEELGPDVVGKGLAVGSELDGETFAAIQGRV